MQTKDQGPLRYKDGTHLIHRQFGWCKTVNPDPKSEYVEIVLKDGTKRTIHEDDVNWPITYADMCTIFSQAMDEKGAGLVWLYTPNKSLGNRSPKDAMEDGDLELVKKVLEETPRKSLL